MNGYIKCFDNNNNKYMNLIVHDEELVKKYNEIWDKVKDLFLKSLIVNQCIMINILKLKLRFTIIECIQVFSIIKHQKIMNIVFVCL